MAIEFNVPKTSCERCGHELMCVNCDFDRAEHLIGITSGQRDVLLDILRYTKDGEVEGTVTMNAADKVDLLALLDQVEGL